MPLIMLILQELIDPKDMSWHNKTPEYSYFFGEELVYHSLIDTVFQNLIA
jgi:hypothetical protein